MFIVVLQDKTALVQLQENILHSRKEGSHENLAKVVTQEETWGNADERDLSQALEYKFDALKDSLLRDALAQQLSVAEWAALSESDRNYKLAQMKLKVQAMQREGIEIKLCSLMYETLSSLLCLFSFFHSFSFFLSLFLSFIFFLSFSFSSFHFLCLSVSLSSFLILLRRGFLLRLGLSLRRLLFLRLVVVVVFILFLPANSPPPSEMKVIESN